MSLRREWRWLIIATAALATGALGARSYARLAAPYYAMVARLVCRSHAWQIDGVQVVSQSGPGAVLQLTGTVRQRSDDPLPAARLVSKLQVAAVTQSPVIFWSVLLAWPMRGWRQRLKLLLLGVPMLLALEAATSVCQLLTPFAYVSALLSGHANHTSGWEHWSRFLEEGGRVVLALGAALCVVALCRSRPLSGMGPESGDRGAALTPPSDQDQQSAEAHA